ncbi:hypothetical protein EDD80_10331 [Anseongella ginsenosidimutans]|uniref:Uncharacterized protein n=1 Tax=Anseongella ginsenosidimutans TaxID=496056 RepID=A0A4R3KTA5_9SPHI|nr:hypothetical protein [Anseongella ginsenosidimutans]QEC53297.1 hypothetical protein FRZ59_13750 [Anseongella ginsenosidimutans]TCS88170.1 hypothetical protein EDD80_10331 [Anseongella ginsenosidimutans]
MRSIVLSLVLLSIIHLRPAAAQEVCSIGLGDTLIHVLITGDQEGPVHFLNLHDDENTAVKAALQVMEEKGGRLVELKHSGERLVKFPTGNRSYQFDPNRMFTAEGRKATLKRYGSTGLQAEKALAGFADSLLQVYDIANIPCIITLHNNTEDNFSAKSYLPGAIYDKEARKVYLASGADADDFVVVTRSRYYRFYKRKDINVVLQSKNPTDDGSLSVYAEWEGLPYINIEAQEGHLEQQVRMISVTYQLLLEPAGFFSRLFGNQP